MSALVKATEELTSTAVVLLFQNLICFLLILPFALRGGLASLKTEKIGLHVLRAVSGTLAWYALFVAITMMPLTNAILLTFSAPLWMPVIAGCCSARRYPGRRGWAPPSDSSASFWSCSRITSISTSGPHRHGSVAFCLSIAFMSVRWLGATEPTSRILFYYFLIASVLCAPFAFVDWRPFGLRGSIYLLGIALTLLVSQALIVLAYRYASAVKVGPFIYTVIVFTALIDWFLWNRAPTLLVVFGMALVIGGGIIAVRKRQNPAEAGVGDNCREQP